MIQKEKTDEKTFKVMNENGKCYTFSMRNDATHQDALNYAKIYLMMAGCSERIVKVWEPGVL